MGTPKFPWRVSFPVSFPVVSRSPFSFTLGLKRKNAPRRDPGRGSIIKVAAAVRIPQVSFVRVTAAARIPQVSFVKVTAAVRIPQVSFVKCHAPRLASPRHCFWEPRLASPCLASPLLTSPHASRLAVVYIKTAVWGRCSGFIRFI